MVTNVLIFLWIALLLTIVVYVLRRKYNNLVFPFQDWEKTDIPYITIDVQGHQLNMITDSAAAVSIIRKDALEMLTTEQSSRRISLSAITNDSVSSQVVTIPIVIKGKEFKTDFLVYEGNDIADFGNKYGVVIHGLLGVEFFRKTKGMVDFNKQSIVFPV